MFLQTKADLNYNPTIFSFIIQLYSVLVNDFVKNLYKTHNNHKYLYELSRLGLLDNYTKTWMKLLRFFNKTVYHHCDLCVNITKLKPRVDFFQQKCYNIYSLIPASERIFPAFSENIFSFSRSENPKLFRSLINAPWSAHGESVANSILSAPCALIISTDFSG